MCTQSFSHSKFSMSHGVKPIYEKQVCELMKQGNYKVETACPYRDSSAQYKARRFLSFILIFLVKFHLIICLNSSSSYTTMSGINLTSGWKFDFFFFFYTLFRGGSEIIKEVLSLQDLWSYNKMFFHFQGIWSMIYLIACEMNYWREKKADE